MLVKFEQNRIVETTRNFELFDEKKKKKKKERKKKRRKKHVFIKTIFDKALTPFWKTFL